MPVISAVSPKAILAILIGLGFIIVIIGIIKEQTGSRNLNLSLLRAARGDRQLAARLLENAKLRYPGQSDRWYIEKIIYKQERDGAGSGRIRRMGVNCRDLRETLWIATAACLDFFRMLTRGMGDVMGSRNRV